MNFDDFVTQLLGESKAFYEKAKIATEGNSKEAYLHSSFLLIMSALEACINSIAEELLVEPYINNYSFLEQSLLLEKEIVFKNGCYKLGSGLKMTRITEKIEFLIFKFSGNELSQSEPWFVQLKQSINLRNRLVHPKEHIALTENQVENAISSVMDTINELYKVVYKKAFPSYSLGTSSKITIE